MSSRELIPPEYTIGMLTAFTNSRTGSRLNPFKSPSTSTLVNNIPPAPFSSKICPISGAVLEVFSVHPFITTLESLLSRETIILSLPYSSASS